MLLSDRSVPVSLSIHLHVPKQIQTSVAMRIVITNYFSLRACHLLLCLLVFVLFFFTDQCLDTHYNDWREEGR